MQNSKFCGIPVYLSLRLKLNKREQLAVNQEVAGSRPASLVHLGKLTGSNKESKIPETEVQLLLPVYEYSSNYGISLYSFNCC